MKVRCKFCNKVFDMGEFSNYCPVCGKSTNGGGNLEPLELDPDLKAISEKGIGLSKGWLDKI